MLRFLGTLALALLVGVMLTAAPCVDCVAKIQQSNHHCCGKPKPEPGHKCASEAKTTSAETKTVTVEALAVGETVMVAEPECTPDQAAAPLHVDTSPPASPPLDSIRC
jgi:hypothetical protein